MALTLVAMGIQLKLKEKFRYKFSNSRPESFETDRNEFSTLISLDRSQIEEHHAIASLASHGMLVRNSFNQPLPH